MSERHMAPEEPKQPARLGILLSGRGSNFLAIQEAIAHGPLKGKAEIAVVIANVAEAPGLDRARKLGLPTALYVSQGRKRSEHDADVAQCLRDHGVTSERDLVILAGYMRLLSPEFIQAFPNKILNIHPSLLPAFPGLDAQTQAFNYGCRIAGCTVHFVDEKLDHGVIILQRAINVEAIEDAHTLSEVLLIEEHQAYPEAIARVLSGNYQIEGRRYTRKP